MSAARERVVRWKRAAGDDLAAIIDYIAADSPDGAERFLEAILARIQSLERFPFSGGICPHYPKARQIVFGNYIVYYTVGKRDIVIRAVVHGARSFRMSWLRRR